MSVRLLNLSLAFLLLVSIGSLPVRAKIGGISLDQLVTTSDVIVVARVESVRNGPNGTRRASATVLESWKGSPGVQVEFLASPTWTCDIADANPGERAVLFLIRPKGSAGWQLAHAGRGRMPLRVVDEKTFATYWNDIRLDADLPTSNGPDPRYAFIRSVELAPLRKRIAQAAVEPLSLRSK